jgi:serine/threonine protein kinase
LGLGDGPRLEQLCVIEEDCGKSLKEEVSIRNRSGLRFTIEELLMIMQSILSAVNSLHQLGFAHKQITLNNIFLSPNSCRLGGVLEPISHFKERFLS